MKDIHVNHITPRHSRLAIRGDKALDAYVEASIYDHGILRSIHSLLGISRKSKGAPAQCTQWCRLTLQRKLGNTQSPGDGILF
ncbi:hypothetical protein V8E53_012806 [Lactarius tabidus]